MGKGEMINITDDIILVWRDTEGNEIESEVTLVDFMDNGEEWFLEQLEPECTSSGCHNESFNGCDCNPVYENYGFVGIKIPVKHLDTVIKEQSKLLSESSRIDIDECEQIIESLVNSHSPTEPVTEHSSYTEFDTLQPGDWFKGTEEEYRKVLALELLPKHKFSTSMIPAVEMQLRIIESDIDLYSSLLLKHGYCAFIDGSLTWDEDKLKKTQLTAPEFIRRAENTFKKK